MALATKELALAIDLARDVGVPVEMAALVEQIHHRARVRYGDQAGEMSAIRLYEELAGTELRLAYLLATCVASERPQHAGRGVVLDLQNHSRSRTAA